MLRTLLGEPSRKNEGLLGETIDAMAGTARLLRKEMEISKDPTHDFRKLEIWVLGLITSLDELEQCLFASAFFRGKVTNASVDDMDPAERGDYARHVFFYKDGFIRVFATLDKLGTVLNELFDLETSKVKEHFSYFTVLRQFNYKKTHLDLARELEKIKDQYKDALRVLRGRRNMEIHYMNSELKDDLWQRNQALQGKIKLEDLDEYLRDLEQGLHMVTETLRAVFTYTNQRWKKLSRK